MKGTNNKGAISKQSFSFAKKVVYLYKDIIAEHKEYVLSKQLLRSGTAVGALVREAQNAESTADFVHKLGIAQKECDESVYWLDLLYETEFINSDAYENLTPDAESLLRMIRSAIVTTKMKKSKK